MKKWIDCKAKMPTQKIEGVGAYSKPVIVLLSNGEISEDWLINGKWVIHCRNNGGAYPIKWQEKN